MTEPTNTKELVRAPPSYVGYCDACKFGAGGVWVSGVKELPPFVWRYRAGCGNHNRRLDLLQAFLRDEPTRHRETEEQALQRD